MKEKIIEFLRKKDYKYIENIGQGGTGKTVLIVDETINEMFVCKKYSPFYDEHKDKFFGNFVDEIKLLHLIYHKNIVRVFNYYLFPERTTGYILMEFINGKNINSYIKENLDKLGQVFIQAISGFTHLEENGILHRDIRPENILVSNDGIVKIIDFGFGKKVDFKDANQNSVSLNWRYTIPKDFENKIYDFRTEVYFIGKLFEEIIREYDIQNFPYTSLLSEMISFDYTKRIGSFFDVDRKIIQGDTLEINFSEDDEAYYRNFADELKSLFTKISYNAEYMKDVAAIVDSLENCYRNSILERNVQNPLSVAQCFVRGQYYYNRSALINVSNLKNFIKLFKSVSSDKKRIILNNLWQRLDSINRYNEPVDDDLPF